MIHLQLIRRNDENLQTLIREALASDKIRAFKVAGVAGGLKLEHKKWPGTIRFSRTKGALCATISCTNPSREWQLLETFVGRLAYHFSGEIAAVNIQFVPPRTKD